MRIDTKFEIGETVWTVDYNPESKSVEVASGRIDSIYIGSGGLEYYFDKWYCEYPETALVKYDDTDTLMKRILELDKED